MKAHTVVVESTSEIKWGDFVRILSSPQELSWRRAADQRGREVTGKRDEEAKVANHHLLLSGILAAGCWSGP